MANRKVIKSINQQTTNNQQPTTILGIDTATAALVIAIGQIGDTLGVRSRKADLTPRVSPSNGPKVPINILGSYFALIGRKHLELSVATIKEIIEQSGIKLQDLKAIVAGLGPGSLIGSRIGLMVAKTLAQVLKIPVIGISTLDVIAVGPVKIGKEFYPSPEGLVKLGFKRYKKKQFSSIYELEPIYLRGPV